MSGIACMDLMHLGQPRCIAAYLVSGTEPTLVDPGPSTTVPALVAGLADHGVGRRDLRHVVLTHVHLDHAGGTGHVVEAFPEATVHVHEDGVRHMVEPERLVASTRRTFGDAHDQLWGEMRPVPAERIRGWSPGEPGTRGGLRPIPTPGHIAHHLAYLDEGNGILFSGDAMGIVLADEAPTHPPTPPPSADLRAWERTLDEIVAVGPERFGATHFGLYGSVPERVEQLRAGLAALETRVRVAISEGDEEEDARRFQDEVRTSFARYIDPDSANHYFGTFGAYMDWKGVEFYLRRNP